MSETSKIEGASDPTQVKKRKDADKYRVLIDRLGLRK